LRGEPMKCVEHTDAAGEEEEGGDNNAKR